MSDAFVLKDRSDQELLKGVWAAVRREYEDVALVIAHLAEIDKRKLFAEEGCSSLKSYCMEVLHMSEEQTYPRIHVARIVQKFPVILEMLADGLVHLTAVHRLGPSLTEENHLSVLEEAEYKSMAQVEEIVARLRPKPPVPSRVRKLSSRKPGVEVGEGLFENGPDSFGNEDEAEPAGSGRSGVTPLAPDFYEVRFTADKETVDALKLLQELLSHEIPNGDPAVIIKDSLLLRLKQVKRQKFGEGKSKGKESESAVEEGKRPETAPVQFAVEAPEKTAGEQPASRYIPKEIKKAVWERDQGRCAFMARNGRWCSERRWLEFHHVVPFAWGGETTINNIELRCRTHNAYEGELIFGKVLRKSSAKALLAAKSTGFKTSSVTGRSSG